MSRVHEEAGRRIRARERKRLDALRASEGLPAANPDSRIGLAGTAGPTEYPKHWLVTTADGRLV